MKESPIAIEETGISLSTAVAKILPKLAIALSFVLITIAVQINYQNSELATASYNHSQALNQLANDLRYYDEVLTLSAIMAAQTNDPQWQERYQQTLPLLNASVKAATNPATESTLLELSRINQQLTDLEMKLFTLLEKGLKAQAIAHIETLEYSTLKQKYGDCLKVLGEILKQESLRRVNEIDERESHARKLRRTGLFIIIALWISVAFNTGKLGKLLLKSNEQLTSQAHFDSLTGIANRTLFMDRLQMSLAEAKRKQTTGALLLLDLDNFKSVNDSLGHPIGDKLLAVAASRLTAACRASDTVARLGGDEFAVIAKDIKAIEQSSVLAQKLIAILKQPISIDGYTINAQASIGIASFPADADQADELLRKADLALYKAKALGKNIHAYFDQEIETSAKNRQGLEDKIQHGIKHNEFELYYQPIVRLSDQAITGVEALIRWHHPDHGLVAPDAFIAVAEESRLIIPLGKWVYQQACKQHRLWLNMGLPPLTISVNVSGVQFEDDELFDGITAALIQQNMDPCYFIAEITESTLMSAVSASNRAIAPMDVMKRLSALGIKIAIDDFGTGYSSLAYLKRFPIDLLKIDREFIKGLPNDTEDTAITRAILHMSDALNLKVVAEGIETEQQLNYLTTELCEYAQGYYLGKPMPADQFEIYFGKQQSAEKNIMLGRQHSL